MQFIGLLDCNNFFVSCERLFRPDLRTVPTMVLSSNDGCVVARSQEIKDKGIPMGVPYFKIKDSLKSVEHAVFSSNFTLYRDISARVFSVMESRVERMERYSIDEAFFKISDLPIEQIEPFLISLRNEIMQSVGIPVSIGVSHTKTQAKYANVLAKKTTGIRIVDNFEFRTLAPQIKLGEIWGVATGRTRQFAAANLHTVHDLIEADPARVERLFGIAGLRLQSELSGIPASTLLTEVAIPKSVTSSRSFAAPTTDRSVVLDAVAYHVREVMEDIRLNGLKTRCVKVSIRPSHHGDYFMRGGSKDSRLLSPTNDTIEVMKICTALVKELFETGVPYKKAGVILTDLVPESVVQTNLFAEAQTGNELMSTVDQINSSFGQQTLRIGAQSKQATWSSRKDKLSPAYTTQWENLADVKA